MIDLDKAIDTAKDAAFAAGELIKQGFGEPMKFESKGDPADRLTQVDLNAQKIIREKLAEEFPATGFLGEEDEGRPASRSLGEVRWIVDPLDGTMNFTHRLPFCGTSIGLEIDGEMVVGVIHFPMLNWPASRSLGEGWTYTAVKGKGAFRNNQPIHTTDCKRFEDALIAEIFSDRESRGKKVQYPASTAFRKFGSAITSTAFVADGSVDGTVIRCRKWDIAAAEVIIREAGGSVTVRLDHPDDPRSALTIIASSPGIHGEMCDLASELAGSNVMPG